MSLLENSQNHQTLQGLKGSLRGQGKLKVIYLLLRMASSEMIVPPPLQFSTTESLTESHVPYSLTYSYMFSMKI